MPPRRSRAGAGHAMEHDGDDIHRDEEDEEDEDEGDEEDEDDEGVPQVLYRGEERMVEEEEDFFTDDEDDDEDEDDEDEDDDEETQLLEAQRRLRRSESRERELVRQRERAVEEGDGGVDVDADTEHRRDFIGVIEDLLQGVAATHVDGERHATVITDRMRERAQLMGLGDLGDVFEQMLHDVRSGGIENLPRYQYLVHYLQSPVVETEDGLGIIFGHESDEEFLDEDFTDDEGTDSDDLSLLSEMQSDEDTEQREDSLFEWIDEDGPFFIESAKVQNFKEWLNVQSGKNHNQGADSVCAFACAHYEATDEGVEIDEEERIKWSQTFLVTGRNDVSLYKNGKCVGMTKQRLPFSVYSVAYDEETSMVAVCGMSTGYGELTNVAIFKLEQTEETVIQVLNGMHDGGSTILRVEDERSSAFFHTWYPQKMKYDSAVRKGTYDEKRPEPYFPKMWEFTELCQANIGAPHYDRTYQHMQADSLELAEQANCIRFARLQIEANQPKELKILISSNDKCVYVCRLEAVMDEENVRVKSHKLVKDFIIPRLTNDSVNCAVASPCGTMVACAGDNRQITVKVLSMGTHGRVDVNAQGVVQGKTISLKFTGASDAPGASQYLAWSPDGRYLAATSDSDNAVMVWLAVRDSAFPFHFRSIAHIHSHRNACLPVMWSISNPSIMIYGERGGRFHMIDVAQAEDYHNELVNALEVVKDSRPRPSREFIREQCQALINMRLQRSSLHLALMEGYSKNPDPIQTANNLLDLAFGDINHKGEFHTMWKAFNIQTFREGTKNEYITGLSVQKGMPCPGSLTTECCADYIYVSKPHDMLRYTLPTGLRKDCKNFSCFPPMFRHAAREFLRCARLGRLDAEARLPDLPQDVLQMIVSKMATPFYRWGELEMIDRREWYLDHAQFEDIPSDEIERLRQIQLTQHMLG